MPRKARFFIDEVPVHVVQRGHCREPVFFEAQDYATYMHWVHEASKRYEVKLHSFCLMTNHVHLLLTPVLADHRQQKAKLSGAFYCPSAFVLLGNSYACTTKRKEVFTK
jgi:putative transposase